VLDLIPEHGKAAALCELNVIEQVVNVSQSTVLQDAWGSGQDVTLHGWVYGLHDGLIQNLHMTVTRHDDLQTLYGEAISGIRLMPRNIR
jgi:carbonic anhydrase